MGQPQASAAPDAGDGDRGAGSAPGTSKAAPGTDIPLPAARLEDYRAEPRVGGRRDLHPDGVRLPLSGGDHRLGQPERFWRERLSNTNDASFCAAALEEALFGSDAADFNTDQGSTFTARLSPQLPRGLTPFEVARGAI